MAQFSKQEIWTPSKLGLDGVTFASERTSNTFGLRGVEQIDLFVFHDYTAATGVDIHLDTAPDESGTPSRWYTTESTSVSSGTGTLTAFKFQRDTGADASFSCSFTDVNAMQGRLRINDKASGTTDTITVTMILKFGA